jgi:hypothetical protein
MYRTCLELIPDNRIIVDNISDPVEELDDLLGHVVAGSSLTTNIYLLTFLTFSLEEIIMFGFFKQTNRRERSNFLVGG